jgi:hypothetical protein
MGCFNQAPPLSTKLLVNTRCVSRVGTHYVVALHPDAAARRCVNLYTPLGSKATRLAHHRGGASRGSSSGGSGSLSGGLGSFGITLGGFGFGFGGGVDHPYPRRAGAELQRRAAKGAHRSCAGALHLNHYAVKSREDYLGKFQRGRISRSASDVASGLATRNATTGQVLLAPLPPHAVVDFLSDDKPPRRSINRSGSAGGRDANDEGRAGEGTGEGSNRPLDAVAAKLLALAALEFAVRDFSVVRDEAILKFLPLLKLRLARHQESLLNRPRSDDASPLTAAAGLPGARRDNTTSRGSGGSASSGGSRPRARAGRSGVAAATRAVQREQQLQRAGGGTDAHAMRSSASRYRLDPGWPRAPTAVSHLCQGLPAPLGDPNDASNFVGRRGHKNLLPVRARASLGGWRFLDPLPMSPPPRCPQYLHAAPVPFFDSRLDFS